jgi:hypothetical protein
LPAAPVDAPKGARRAAAVDFTARLGAVSGPVSQGVITNLVD